VCVRAGVWYVQYVSGGGVWNVCLVLGCACVCVSVCVCDYPFEVL
jgi:hypothetical protein